MSVSRYLEYFRGDEVKQIALLSMDGGDLRRDPELDVQNLMRWPTDMRIVGIYQQFSGLCEREVHSYIPLRFPLV